MPLDHYLPAAYLGFFSLDKSKANVRDRKLAVYNFNTKVYYQSRAGNLCAINNYFDKDVDKLWYFEGDIPAALNALINETLDLYQWIMTLVPFVASILVRTPDFVKRFQQRISNFGVNQEFSDFIRLLEFQRMLAPIIAGDWKVLEVTGPGQVLLSDLGFIPFTDGQSYLNGVAISLSPRHVLIIVPNRKRMVGVFDGQIWLPVVSYCTMNPGNLHSYNKSIASFARKIIIGPTKESLLNYARRSPDYLPPNVDECKIDFITGALSIPHEFTWHRIVSYMAESPQEVKDEILELDFSKLNKSNCPMVFLPANLPCFPSQVYIQGNTMWVNLYDVDGFPNS